jgi:hypothetical protein
MVARSIDGTAVSSRWLAEEKRTNLILISFINQISQEAQVHLLLNREKKGERKKGERQGNQGVGSSS